MNYNVYQHKQKGCDGEQDECLYVGNFLQAPRGIQHKKEREREIRDPERQVMFLGQLFWA